jgi:DnaK suppressor protein
MNGLQCIAAKERGLRPLWMEHYLDPDQLDELEQALLTLRDQTLVAIKRHQGELRQPMNCTDELDQACLRAEKEHLLSESQRGEHLLRQVNDALRRIRDGSYGYCEESGDPIGYERLRACPFTPLSLMAQERWERLRAIYRC